MTFFSILTATFNVRQTVRKTLESVKMQVNDGVEHLVMDGGSTDGTTDTLRSFEGTYDLKWFSAPDCGIADALNKGLKISKGRYILVLHGDDKLINENILNRVYPMLKMEDTDICAFPVFFHRPSGQSALLKPIQVLWWGHFKTIFLHQGTFVHRRVFNEVGGFRNKFKIALDYDFFYRALSSDVRVQFAELPIASMGGSGLSSRPALLAKRLREEKIVQLDNETTLFWRMAQILFRSLYVPYKKNFSPRKAFRP